MRNQGHVPVDGEVGGPYLASPPRPPPILAGQCGPSRAASGPLTPPLSTTSPQQGVSSPAAGRPGPASCSATRAPPARGLSFSDAVPDREAPLEMVDSSSRAPHRPARGLSASHQEPGISAARALPAPTAEALVGQSTGSYVLRQSRQKEVAQLHSERWSAVVHPAAERLHTTATGLERRAQDRTAQRRSLTSIPLRTPKQWVGVEENFTTQR